MLYMISITRRNLYRVSIKWDGSWGTWKKSRKTKSLISFYSFRDS